MTYLVTGGCGFLGSNLAAEALKRGHDLVVFDNLYRYGASQNLDWLRTLGEFRFFHADIRNPNDVERVIAEVQPDTVFHLAGQVAMTTSLANPRMDFEINALGSLNVLEALRQHAPEAGLIYSSTNKVYGDFDYVRHEEAVTRYVCPDYPQGFSEAMPLDFHSPYGCSKGAADQYALDYARMFGLRTVVFRHSSIYGGRQFSTADQGWIGWFCAKAIEQQRDPQASFSISGDGKQVRDVLYASDAVACYFKASEGLERIKGRAFNIGGGMNNSLSLLELFGLLEEETGVSLRFTKGPWRESDQKVFVADISEVSARLDWQPEVSSREGVRRMLEWVAGTVA